MLIEIDDSSRDAPVTYFYTDRFIIYAFCAGLLREPVAASRGPGRLPT